MCVPLDKNGWAINGTESGDASGRLLPTLSGPVQAHQRFIDHPAPGTQDSHHLVPSHGLSGIQLLQLDDAITAVGPDSVVHITPSVERAFALAWAEDRDPALVLAHPASLSWANVQEHVDFGW